MPTYTQICVFKYGYLRTLIYIALHLFMCIYFHMYLYISRSSAGRGGGTTDSPRRGGGKHRLQPLTSRI
jgi:hypothetical protein